MKKRLITQMVVLTVIHIIMTIGSVMLSFGSGMEAFDNQDYQPSMIGRIADHLAGIITQPALSLWTPWMSKNMPNMLEWVLFIANSMLWGRIIVGVHVSGPACSAGGGPGPGESKVKRLFEWCSSRKTEQMIPRSQPLKECN
jgi:hypothetical protein